MTVAFGPGLFIMIILIIFLGKARWVRASDNEPPGSTVAD
jgi:hypothetical protein